MNLVAALGDENAEHMLAALMDENQITAVAVPLGEQIKTIKRWINVFDFEDKKAFGMILVAMGLSRNLGWCADGTIINLDRLSPEIIGELYRFVINHTNKYIINQI